MEARPEEHPTECGARIQEGAGARVYNVGVSFCTSSLIRGGMGVPVPLLSLQLCAIVKSPSCTCMACGRSPAVPFPADPRSLQCRTRSLVSGIGV